ncbi:MAG: primosomal protein N', partial [Proteobacteria bacterium]|nr:primosomal protein N' [Pseudomonadota bacterium]
VLTQVCTNLHRFYPGLLDGVTGSGKTEVYLQIIQEVLNQGKQAIVLVPEINLTPQTVSRFEQRFSIQVATWHSKLTKTERLHNWLLAKDGIAPIIIGTRSAIWIPLAKPGVFIVDEEHDSSYKQQDHFRYSARDIAVVRAKQAQVPVLLGSATPSLDSLYNANCQRYQHFSLPERAGTAIHPTYHIVDMRHQPRKENLSRLLTTAIRQRLATKQQILLFINRRGYASTLTCYKCGWVAFCQHCDARLTYHETSKNLQCHHCGTAQLLYSQCPDCKHSKLYLLGQGTEKIEENLHIKFPDARILRIDSDSTSRKNAMEKILAQIHAGEVDILIGTQMLAKGHHFPKVTLVGIINIDSGLYGSDFRSTERMAQLLVQVAGRSGRANEPGEVIIQTYHPDHPLLTKLIRQGYSTFAQAALKERYTAAFPPYTYLALLRAESTDKPPLEFLEKAKQLAQQSENVQLWGPVTSPMEKRADWYRAQLLLQALQRKHLHNFIAQWLPYLPASNNKKVRWSLDVDPQDLF